MFFGGDASFFPFISFYQYFMAGQKTNILYQRKTFILLHVKGGCEKWLCHLLFYLYLSDYFLKSKWVVMQIEKAKSFMLLAWW